MQVLFSPTSKFIVLCNASHIPRKENTSVKWTPFLFHLLQGHTAVSWQSYRVWAPPISAFSFAVFQRDIRVGFFPRRAGYYYLERPTALTRTGILLAWATSCALSCLSSVTHLRHFTMVLATVAAWCLLSSRSKTRVMAESVDQDPWCSGGKTKSVTRADGCPFPPTFFDCAGPTETNSVSGEGVRAEGFLWPGAYLFQVYNISLKVDAKWSPSTKRSGRVVFSCFFFSGFAPSLVHVLMQVWIVLILQCKFLNICPKWVITLKIPYLGTWYPFTLWQNHAQEGNWSWFISDFFELMWFTRHLQPYTLSCLDIPRNNKRVVVCKCNLRYHFVVLVQVLDNKAFGIIATSGSAKVSSSTDRYIGLNCISGQMFHLVTVC